MMLIGGRARISHRIVVRTRVGTCHNKVPARHHGTAGIALEVLTIGEYHGSTSGAHVERADHAGVISCADGTDIDSIGGIGIELVEGVGRGVHNHRGIVADLDFPFGLAATGSPADSDAVGRDIGSCQVLHLRAGVVDNLNVVDSCGGLCATTSVVRPEEDQFVGSRAYNKRTCFVGPGVGLCQSVGRGGSVAQVNPTIGNSRRTSSIGAGAERLGRTGSKVGTGGGEEHSQPVVAATFTLALPVVTESIFTTVGKREGCIGPNVAYGTSVIGVCGTIVGNIERLGSAVSSSSTYHPVVGLCTVVEYPVGILCRSLETAEIGERADGVARKGADGYR